MQKTINGKTIKITRAGYLYINGVKQSERVVTPIAPKEITDDPDALELCHEYNAKYYVMVNP
jgi:hypothetical protein